MPSTSCTAATIKRYSKRVSPARRGCLPVSTTFRWTLAPGEQFDTPEAVVCFAPDEDGVSSEMHAFIGEHIVRGKWKKRERPVLVNNWEGTHFDFNEEKILGIARAAKKAGVELFVLDDGWFGNRCDEHRALGDWYDNIEKTGGGLKHLADKIR